MELIRCANCLTVYGDLQDECPQCGADAEGEGAELEFDGTARAAIASLGGVYGGILEGPGDQVVLWCERGVCLYDALCGLMWKTPGLAKVDDVSVTEESVRLRVRGALVRLDWDDGSPLDGDW